MTLSWILVLMVVQLFSESTYAQDKSLCGGLSLQYVFFLVPSSNEFPYLTKFLNSIQSATLFQTSQDERLVQVICDPKDWAEIYRYTVNRDIYFFHSAYCIEKGEISTLEQLRFGRNKLKKVTINEGSGNFIDKETAGEGQRSTSEKNWLNEWNREIKKFLNNGRILHSQDIHSMTYPIEGKIVGGNKWLNHKLLSLKELPSLGMKTISRRSIRSEPKPSWIEESLRRIKRHAWKFLGGNNDGYVRKIRSPSTTPSNEKENSNTTPSSKESNNTTSNDTILSGKNNRNESTLEDSGNGTSMMHNLTTPSDHLNNVTDSGTTNTTVNSRDGTTSSGNWTVSTPVPCINATGNSSRHSTGRHSPDCRCPHDRDVVHDYDDSSPHDLCPESEPQSLAELADYIYKIFQWVKTFEYRGKKG